MAIRARHAGPRRVTSHRAARPGTLLHNISAPAKSVISHTGRNAVHRVWFGLACQSDGPHMLRELVGTMGGPTTGLTGKQVALELARRINARAQTLPLPAAVAVAPDGPHESAQELCLDQRDVITVLAKSSNRVYLRDKEPILERLQPGAQITLILPITWSPS
jgi:hypothetical protein